MEIKIVKPSEDIYPVFREVFLDAFDMEYDYNRFKWTYLSKYSSSSKLIVVYDNAEPVSVRGLWKTSWQNFYQLIDTSVKLKARGKGIFRFSNNFIIENNFDVFNLPNDQSRPGYLKSGWEKLDNIGVTLFTKRNILELDLNQLVWRFVENPVRDYYFQYCIKSNNYKIITIRKGFGVYIGETFFKLDLPEWKQPVFLQYDINRSFFLKKSGIVLHKSINTKPVYNVTDFDMI